MKLSSFIIMYSDPKTKEIVRGLYNEHFYTIKTDKKSGEKMYFIFDSKRNLLSSLPLMNTKIIVIK